MSFWQQAKATAKDKYLTYGSKVPSCPSLLSAYLVQLSFFNSPGMLARKPLFSLRLIPLVLTLAPGPSP